MDVDIDVRQIAVAPAGDWIISHSRSKTDGVCVSEYASARPVALYVLFRATDDSDGDVVDMSMAVADFDAHNAEGISLTDLAQSCWKGTTGDYRYHTEVHRGSPQSALREIDLACPARKRCTASELSESGYGHDDIEYWHSEECMEAQRELLKAAEAKSRAARKRTSKLQEMK